MLLWVSQTLCKMKQVASQLGQSCSKCLHAASCRPRAPRNCGCKQKYNKEAQVSWYKECVCVGGGGNKKQKAVLFLLEGYCFCGVYWKCICLCGTLGSSVSGDMWFSSLTPSAPAVISHKRLWPDVIMADLQIPALPFLAQRGNSAIVLVGLFAQGLCLTPFHLFMIHIGKTILYTSA